MGGVKLDKWGYQVKTSSDKCMSALNDYYHQELSCGRRSSIILEAAADDAKCVLANVMAAHYCSATHPSKASEFLQAAKSHYDEATDYEKAVFEAVSYLILDERDDDVALELHSKLLAEFPRDLVSLCRAQLLCFYMGQPGPSLALVQQVLPKNEGESYVYGMLSYPLLELGRMEDAEKAARKALEINKQDCWAQHCLCHVLQYECRFAEAIKFMEECSPTWISCASSMYVHNWWHIALCYLEAGHSPSERVLDIYDNRIIKELEKPDAARPKVFMNALGLLLRLHVQSEISLFKDRLNALADLLTDRAIWFVEWQLDVFILWALAITERLPAAQELLEGLRFSVSKMSEKKQKLMQRCLSLAEAIYEHGRGNYKHALELLGSDFDANTCKAIGGSDEQIDVFNQVWYILLLNTGQAEKVIDVLEKRIKKRKCSPFLWRLLGKGYAMMGRAEAVITSKKANLLENSYYR